MLTRGDDYPLHQTAEPVAYVGGNRNFYDRFFFNGYSPDGELFFAAAMGVYPWLNILDGAFSVVRGGRQHCVFGSRHMAMERLDLQVGAVAVDIEVPLERLRVRVDDGEHGVRADLVFVARTPAQEEPRFTRYQGSQLMMDVTRMTQFGVWQGWIEVDGERIEVEPAVVRGVRDRSWGIRPVGAADGQPNPSAGEPQFYWLWAPLNFDDGAVHYFVNEDAEGVAWNQGGVLVPLLEGDAGGDVAAAGERMAGVASRLRFASGRRHAEYAEVELRRRDGRVVQVVLQPQYNFYMRGIGYGHAEWGHGRHHGALEAGHEVFEVAAEPPTTLHVQAFCQAEMTIDGVRKHGVGVLEQLVVGPHGPSGFRELMDMAP